MLTIFMLLQGHTQENLYISEILRKNRQNLLSSLHQLTEHFCLQENFCYLYRRFLPIDAACYPANLG
jgi:hypothetical protein